MDPGHILILSGHPGSGKTTTAASLAALPGTPKVHLHSDDFWGFIKNGYLAPWLPEADRQNHMIMEISALVAGRYAANGYFVVLDGVVRPSWLPAFTALGLPVHYIVLRTTAEEAVGRCSARGGDSLSDPAVVADLHGQFADLGDHERHALAVDGLTRDETVRAVSTALGSDRLRIDAGAY